MKDSFGIPEWPAAPENEAKPVPPEKPFRLFRWNSAPGGLERQQKTRAETSAGTSWIIGGPGAAGKADKREIRLNSSAFAPSGQPLCALATGSAVCISLALQSRPIKQKGRSNRAALLLLSTPCLERRRYRQPEGLARLAEQVARAVGLNRFVVGVVACAAGGKQIACDQLRRAA